jgi:hypothetical protein
VHIKELMKQFEKIMSAAAFAEAGEFETAKRMLNERRKVLLVLTGGEPDMKAAKYAINTSKRIGAGIEILYLARNNEEKSFLEEYLEELKTKGIEYQVTQCEKSLKEEITRFIEKEKDIEFVVIDSDEVVVRSAKGRKIALYEWESLKCPVVMVSELAKT